MTDPINNRRPIGPTSGPQQAGPADTKKVTGKQPFQVSGAKPSAESVQNAVGQNFGAIRTRIQDGLAQGMDRKQILTTLAEHELADAFGTKASKQAAGAVADAVMQDPSLSQIFNKLFKLASAET